MFPLLSSTRPDALLVLAGREGDVPVLLCRPSAGNVAWKSTWAAK